MANLENQLGSLASVSHTDLNDNNNPDTVEAIAPAGSQDFSDLVVNESISEKKDDEYNRIIVADSNEDSLEMRLGQHWFSRLGIAALVVGISLFLIYSLQYFGAVGKIAIGYLVSLALISMGYFFEKKFEKYGQVVFGGGVALIYFTTYATYFFKATKIIESQVLVLIMLAVISLLYLAYMFKYKSELMAGIAIGLLFFTTNLGDIAGISLVMLLMAVTITVAVAIWKNWNNIKVFPVFLTYFTLFRWILYNPSQFSNNTTLLFIVGILTFCYFLFLVLNHYYTPDKSSQGLSLPPAFMTVFNSLAYFLLLRLSLFSSYKDDDNILILSFGALNLILALVTKYLSKNKKNIYAHLGIGTSFILLFIQFEFTGLVAYYSFFAVGLIYLIYGLLKGTYRTRLIGLILLSFSIFRVMLSGIDESLTAGYNLLIMAAIIEYFAWLLNVRVLNNNEGDNPNNNEMIQNTSAGISVASIAVAILYIFDSSFVTLMWGVAGFLIPLIGFAIKDKFFRRSGLALLILATSKLFLLDLGGMDIVFRIMSFIILGVILLVLSFGYNKYKEEIRKYL